MAGAKTEQAENLRIHQRQCAHHSLRHCLLTCLDCLSLFRPEVAAELRGLPLGARFEQLFHNAMEELVATNYSTRTCLQSSRRNFVSEDKIYDAGCAVYWWRLHRKLVLTENWASHICE